MDNYFDDIHNNIEKTKEKTQISSNIEDQKSITNFPKNVEMNEDQIVTHENSELIYFHPEKVKVTIYQLKK